MVTARRVVEILWRDSMQLTSTWVTLDTVKDFATDGDCDGMQFSAGYVFKETKKWVTLYGSRSAKLTDETSGHGQVHKIPKCSIVSMTELVGVKKPK